MSRRLALVVSCVAGCSAPTSGVMPDARVGDARASVVDGARPDAPTAADAADAAALGNYRTSLGSCWTDATCDRALVIAHGGEWVLASPPYGTTTAYADAYADNADAIKADVRFSKDGVPVVVHSSPFAAYEIDPADISCLGATVENMNVADIVACRWINGDHIERLDTLLAWAQGKLVVMLTVKVAATIPQTISSVIALHATDFAFLEISTASMTSIVPSAAGFDQVDYLVEAANATDIATLRALDQPRAFMYEDANSDNFGGMTTAAVTAMIDDELHPANVRAFSSIASVTATAADHEALWNEGFDVVMTNSYAAGHQGRIAVNSARGVSPP